MPLAYQLIFPLTPYTPLYDKRQNESLQVGTDERERRLGRTQRGGHATPMALHPDFWPALADLPANLRGKRSVSRFERIDG